MKIDLLQATDLRCFANVSFEPVGGINWLVGANGSGKTTLLEAAYLLSHGRSFRAGGRGAPCRRGASGYLLHASLTRRDREGVKLGLARGEDGWRARMDGVELGSAAPLFEACPVVYFGPESQSLFTGPAEQRRSFLDWSVFHVEHASLELWRDWRRAQRQRNALLRLQAPDRDFVPWEQALAALGERIHAARTACLQSLGPYLLAEAATQVPELGPVRVDYRAGWDVEQGLEQQLAAERPRDRERGFTHHGVHRADWGIRFETVAHREDLSRGQAKASALACVLGQTEWLLATTGEYPLLCLDDLDAELDSSHRAKVLDWVRARTLQVWLTATSTPISSPTDAMFHVEQSGVTQATAGRGGAPTDPV